MQNLGEVPESFGADAEVSSLVSVALSLPLCFPLCESCHDMDLAV